MLIDCTYFQRGPRKIESCTLGSINARCVEVTTAVTETIEFLQEPFLVGMLGLKTGREVQAYLETESEKNEAMEAVCSQLREPFADYVLYHFLRDSSIRVTLTGTTVAEQTDRHVSPGRKMVEAWNRMVDYNRQFAQWARSGCSLCVEVSQEMLTKINILNI